MPFTNNRFKAGSTYRRKFDNNSPDEIGKTLLENGLNKILKVPYSIQNHDSAVRPTAGDHHPILGEHPQIKNMYCLVDMEMANLSFKAFSFSCVRCASNAAAILMIIA